MTSTTVRGLAMLVAVGALVAPTALWVTSQEERGQESQASHVGQAGLESESRQVSGAGQASVAQPARRLVKIQYDPPGDDVQTNSQLNKEWVQIGNFGTKPWKLTGWTLRDLSGSRFKFPSGFTVQPGVTVTIHTGKGTNRAQHLYWRQGNYIWNNTGDKATLRNAAGKVVDTCAYSGTGASVTC